VTEALANLTQVINQSPQVGALAGGHLAAVEAARQEAQVETSRRLREVLAKTVLPLEDTVEIAIVEDPERRRRRAARPASRRGRAPGRTVRPDRGGRTAAEARGTETAGDPFEPARVVDLRV
jgi:hypothetical protein